MKKVTLTEGETTYTLGGGMGSWAKSFEKCVKVGEVRYIGGMLMYAYSIYPNWVFSPDEVNWCPVDNIKIPSLYNPKNPPDEVVNSWDRMKKWMDNL